MSGKAAFRFVVGDDYRCASSWTCFGGTNKEPNDFYLTCQTVRGIFKASFHDAVDWRIAFESAFWNEAPPDGKPPSRLMDSWPRPQEILPGVTVAYRLFVPWDAVDRPTREVFSTHEKSKICFIAPPPAGHAVEIVLLLTSPEGSKTPVIRNLLQNRIGSFNLANGDQVSCFHRLSTPPPEPRNVSEGNGWGAKTDRPLVLDEELRWFFHGADSNGERYGAEFHVTSELKVRLVANPSTPWNSQSTAIDAQEG